MVRWCYECKAIVKANAILCSFSFSFPISFLTFSCIVMSMFMFLFMLDFSFSVWSWFRVFFVFFIANALVFLRVCLRPRFSGDRSSCLVQSHFCKIVILGTLVFILFFSFSVSCSTSLADLIFIFQLRFSFTRVSWPFVSFAIAVVLGAVGESTGQSTSPRSPSSLLSLSSPPHPLLLLHD